MQGEDFYNILGVSENASADEIKKAYRQKSLMYHPDKTNGDVEKVKIFQKISEAYETLGDAEKRNEYDMRKQNPFMRMNSMGGNGEMDINDLFANIFFGGGMPGMQGMPGMFGGNFPPGANIRIFRNGVPVNFTSVIEKPQPIVKTININMVAVLNGAKIPVEIERWSIINNNKVFEVVTLNVDVFKGVNNNENIVLKEQGNAINDTCKGDVNIIITINNDSQFIRQGLDLIMQKDISLKESLCGFSFEIKYINGKVYTINNQPGNIISPNYNKLIQNMGLTRESTTGNLIIQFTTKFPETLTAEQIDALSKIL